jgi:hypothetical protein
MMSVRRVSNGRLARRALVLALVLGAGFGVLALSLGSSGETRPSPARSVTLLGPSGSAASSSFAHLATLEWCGSGETPDNRLPQVDPLTSSTVRVFYAFPSDTPSRFESVAGAIVSDVAAIDRWWREEDPTRAPRWDLYAFPGCPEDVVSLDLSVLPLERETAYYAASTGFERILREVAPHLGPSEKALVYFDGIVIDPQICGVSQQAPRNGGVYGVSVTAIGSSCWVDLGTGSQTAKISVHELMHNLGAVPAKAPNSCGNPATGAHVCDNPDDLMFPFASAERLLPDAILDVGRNDYYAHSGAWWDVQDSAWLVHLPLRTLVVAVSGPGSVSSAPDVVACPGRCATTTESDFVIRLVANTDPGSEFYGWTGACKGEKECAVKMTGDLSVQARFGAPRPTLFLGVKGSGRVTSAPTGLSCPGRCSGKYATGTLVTLRARPAAGWKLGRWSSPCGAKSVCAIRLTRDTKVSATFIRSAR